MLSLVSIARDACQGEWTVHEGLAINVSHVHKYYTYLSNISSILLVVIFDCGVFIFISSFTYLHPWFDAVKLC